MYHVLGEKNSFLNNKVFGNAGISVTTIPYFSLFLDIPDQYLIVMLTSSPALRRWVPNRARQGRAFVVPERELLGSCRAHQEQPNAKEICCRTSFRAQK